MADLGQGIGSGRWFGALALLLVLLSLPFAVLWATRMLNFSNPTLSAAATTIAQARVTVPAAKAPQSPNWDGHVTLGASGSIKETLRTTGLRASDAHQADSLITSALFPDRADPATRVSYRFASVAPFGERPLEKLELRPRLDTRLVIIGNGGNLSVVPQAIAVDATPLRVRGTVGSDLALSAVTAGLPREVVPQLVAGLAANPPSGGGVRAGDTFDLVVNFRRAVDGEARAGDLLFAAIAREAKPVAEMLRWGNDSTLRSIDRAGSETRWPVQGRRTSGFGMRYHPILGYPRLHRGIDFGAPAGTAIYAVAGGTVSFAGRHGGHGNYVCIDHGRGLATCYAHLSRIDVTSGVRLGAGAMLGAVGSTGLSTGPHLHYEVYRDGRPVDPARESIAARGRGRAAELPDSLAAGIAVLRALDPAAGAPKSR